MDIAYTGEWTWAASLGRLLLALAFASGIASTIGYTKAVRNKDAHWLTLGRWGFRVQATGLFAASALMFFLIFCHRYEPGDRQFLGRSRGRVSPVDELDARLGYCLSEAFPGKTRSSGIGHPQWHFDRIEFDAAGLVVR